MVSPIWVRICHLVSKFRWKDSSRPLVDWLTKQPSSEELLARYVTDRNRKSWLKRLDDDKTVVRPKAFQPDSLNEVSTYRIGGLEHSDCVLLGKTEFADKQSKPSPLIGWAQLKAQHVYELNLILDISEDPIRPMHRRHAGIRGWPPWPSGSKEGKGEEMMIFDTIAANSNYIPV